MRSSIREKGVLKLIHPGRHIEIHKQPITAAEVISKNPRHSVTRPDVFQYPWIVVRPESILVLGEVFYIVPNRTIHKLLISKSKGKSFTDDDKKILLQKQNLARNSCAGSTPKHQRRGRDEPRQHGENGQAKGRSNPSWREVVNKKEGNNKVLVDSSLVNSNKCNRTVFAESQNVDKKLKSCMRKNGDLRKSRYLRVKFESQSEIEHNVMQRKGFGKSLKDMFRVVVSLGDQK